MEEMHHLPSEHSINGLSSLKRSISLTAVKIPMRQCSVFQMKLAPYLLNKPYSPNIIRDSKDTSLDQRVVLLKESVNKELEGIPEDLKKWIDQEKNQGVEVITFDLEVDYKSYSLEQIMTELLPSHVDKILKVESINDIKILDLTAEQWKYREFIGKVVLEKSPLTKTVLVRSRHHHGDHPLFKYFCHYKYELLCGEPKTEIEIAEGHCKYKINLLNIYYESTLQEERERTLSIIGKDNFICDLFGDLLYSITAAKVNHSHISSNCNGNKELYKSYSENIKLNAVETLIDLKNENLYTFLEESLNKEHKKEDVARHVNHIYLSSFLEDCNFLKIFVGLFTKINNQAYEKEEHLPQIHFYLFVNNEEFTDSMKRVLTAKLNKILNESFSNKEIKDIVHTDDFDSIFIVKDEHTRKLLQCTIRLSKKVAYCSEVLYGQVLEIPSKMAIEEESREETKEETKEDQGTATKSKKGSTAKKNRKPPTTTTELEKDEDVNEEGLRRSSRKKTKPKQHDDFEYTPIKSNRESSK